MNPLFRSLRLLLNVIPACCLIAGARAQSFQAPPTEIVSAWKHNSENLVVIFRHDGVFYIVDGEPVNSAGQAGMERGTYTWDKASGAFSANVVVDTNGNAGLSDPNGGTSVTISGNTLTYSVTGEGDYSFTRIVNSPASAIVGSWYLPGEDVNLTFLANGIYYHSEESDNQPDSTTGMERGTYTWDSGAGALSATPITDTNGDIGLSDLAPSPTFTISGNIMTITEGTDTATLRRITPILAPLAENDFEVDKFANYRQTSSAAPSLLTGPPDDDQPFWGEAYIEDTVSGSGGTMTITGQSPRNFVNSDGWGIETEYASLAGLNAASAFPNGSNYVFSRTGGAATLSYPAHGAFPPAPAVVGGDGNGSWSNGKFILGENQTLIWSPHTAYDPATLVTVLSVVDQESGEEILYEEVMQGDIASFDLRGKLISGRSYDAQIEHVKIAGSTTAGTGSFAGKLGYALYNSNTRFTMVAQAVEVLEVKKRIIAQQQSATFLAPPAPTFNASVQGEGITATFPSSTITLTRPDNSSFPLVFDEDHWDAEEIAFPSLVALQAAFPNGVYKINIASDAIPINMNASNFPNQPLITSSAGTWANGKLRITASQAAAGFNLTSNASTGDSTIRLSVFDSQFNDIVNQKEEPSIGASTVTAIVPAGGLVVGLSYTAEAEFNEIIDYSELMNKSWGSSPNGRVEAFGFLSSETFLTIEVVADPVGSPYDTWQSGVFTPTQLANPAVSGDDADFDNDGIETLLEFILGGSPTTPNPNLLKTATTTPAPGGRNLVFFYDRKIAANGITQVIETSPTLTGTWTPAVHGVNGVVIATSTLDGSTQRVTATIPSTETELFVRLKASR